MFLYPSVPVDFDHLLHLSRTSGVPSSSDQAVVSGPEFVCRVRHILSEAEDETDGGDQALEGSIVSIGETGVQFGRLVEELDVLFANRLKNPGASCWPFIRQFLPRSQLDMYRKCTVGKPVKARVRLWLRSSINDRSLFWLFGSFLAAKDSRMRFYREHALMRQDVVLEDISALLLDISRKPFSRRSSHVSVGKGAGSVGSACSPDAEVSVRDRRGCILTTERLAPAEIAEDLSKYCQGSTTTASSKPRSSNWRRKARISAPKIDEGDSSSMDSTLLDFDAEAVVASTPLESVGVGESFKTTQSPATAPCQVVNDCSVANVDQGDENLSSDNEKQVLNAAFSLINCCSSETGSLSTSPDELHPSNEMALRRQSRYDKAQTEKKDFADRIRHHLESVSEVLATYSEAVREEQSSGSSGSGGSEYAASVPPPNTAESRMANLEDGEIMLESGQIVELAVHVFTEEAEQFYKMFRFYNDHNKGIKEIRYLVLTNQAVYVVSREMIGNSTPSFVRHFGTSYDRLDHISVGLGSQMIILHMSQDKRQKVICTCGQQLTRVILSALEVSLRRHASANESTPSVLVDSTKQKMTIAKWMAGELSSVTLPVFSYNLVFWHPNVDDQSTSQQLGRRGFLYFRKASKFAWLNIADDWTQDYFILRGHKLYQFEDSSCKVGKRVYNLKEEVTSCREVEDNDYEGAFELLVNGESGGLQFASATKAEALQWMNSIIQCTSEAESDDDSCLACCCVLTDGYLFLGQETNSADFVRTLAYTELTSFDSLIISFDCHCLLLRVQCSVEDFRGEWLLSFSADEELRGFVKCLQKQLPKVRLTELDPSCPAWEKCVAASKHWTTF